MVSQVKCSKVVWVRCTWMATILECTTSEISEELALLVPKCKLFINSLLKRSYVEVPCQFPLILRLLRQKRISTKQSCILTDWQLSDSCRVMIVRVWQPPFQEDQRNTTYSILIVSEETVMSDACFWKCHEWSFFAFYTGKNITA